MVELFSRKYNGLGEFMVLMGAAALALIDTYVGQ